MEGVRQEGVAISTGAFSVCSSSSSHRASRPFVIRAV